MTLWSDDITLTLTIDGNAISGSVIASASWRAGRPDWFAQLAPGTASFTLRGDLTGSISCGDPLVLSRGSDTLWTGKVASVGLSSLPLRVVGQNLDETIVTGGDFVAQLGEARLKSKNIAYDTFDDQLEDVLSTVGLTATVSRAISLDNPFVRARTGYTGSVLDWLNDAEREANTVTAVLPDGEIVLCLRDKIPDYGERVYDFAVGPAMPGLPSAYSLWRMDESSGDITDTINARDGTKVGTPTYSQTGPWGSDGPDAIGFTKADAADEFTIGDSFDLPDASTTTWTIAGWVYWSGSAASDSCIMSKVTGGNGWTLSVLTSGRLRFQALNTSVTVIDAQTADGAIVANTWTHVAVTRSGDDLVIYKNGVSVGTATATGDMPNTAASFRIGSNAGSSEWFDGSLCMLSIWNDAALTAAQVLDLIYLDYVTLPSPRTWRTDRSITSVINHWLIAGTPYTDATSISTYGRRTWDVDDASDNNYSAALRTVMKDPRPIVRASLSVTDDSSPLITMAPLDLVEYDGTLYQLLDIEHNVSTDRWDVNLTLDRTQNDMTGGASILPV